MDNLQIQVQAIIDEVKSLLGLQSSLQKIGEKLSLPVVAKLDKAKSRQQLKNDLATLDKLSVKLTGKLNKGDTRKAIKSDVKSLENEKIKLKATVDTKSIKKSLDSVKGASVDVDAKVDGAENVKKLEDGMDGINRVAPSAVGNVILLNKAISGLERAAREMVETAVELDEKLTDLRMVTGDSYDDAKALVDSYNDLAKELGATTAELLDASSEWLRQGMSTEETAQLIEQSMILSKVGAMDAATATENLTSAMKGYGLTVSDVSGIVDKLTAIDLQAAVSSSDLAVGMSRTATSANIAGVSMDRLLGYLAVVQETTQKSAETIGESFKTIFARIGNVKLGNYIDENGEDLSDVETVLKHFGIALRDAQGDFRNTADVLDELYQKWNQFSGVDKRAVANAFAGTRQQENFLVLMENYGKALEYTEVAADSAGTALEKFGAYQDSLQAKMNSFTAAFESLSMNALDADFLGTLIEAGTAMLQFADNTNLVKIALAGLSAAGVVKGFTALTGHIKSAYENVSKLSAAFNMLDNAADVGLTAKEFDSLLSVTNGLNTSQLRLIVTNKALTNEQRMAILTASGLTTEEAAQTLATLGLSTAEATATTATFSLSGAFKALTAAIAANPIGFLVVALTTAVTIISSVADKVKQAQEEARQAALDAAEATKTEIEAINDLLSAYKDANEAYLSNTGSKKDLESATDALLAKLGVERSEINGLVEEYGNLDKALHGITADALKGKWSDLLSGLKASEDDLLAATENGWFSSYNVISGQGAKTAEILNRAGLISDGSYNENFAVYLGDNESIDGVLEMYDKLLAMDKALTDAVANGELSSDFLKDDDFYNLVKGKINDMKEYVEAYRQYVSDMNGIAAQIQIEEYLSSADAPSSIEEYLALRNEMFEESSNNEMFYGDYQDRINAIDNYMQDAFSAIYDQYAANQAKIEAIANNMIPKDFESLEEGTAAHFHAIDEYGVKIADLKAKLAGLSETDLDIAYNILSVPESGINSWEQLTAAINEYKNGTGDIIAKSSAAKSILSTLWSSEDFEDTRKSIAEMANSIDGITAENIDELTKNSGELASVLEIDGMNAQFLAHILQVMAEGGDGVALITEQALKLNDALDGMVDKFDSVTEAKARYDAAMSVEEKDTDFKSYAEAFEELNKQFEAGTTNSNAFWAAAEFLFGSDQLSTWGWSDGLDEIYSAMEKNKIVFEDADSAGAGFVERLYQMSQAGQLVNDQGEKLLDISKDSDGSYVFDIDPDNLDAIAEKMGITTDAVLACLEALSMWGDIDFYDMNEVADVIDEIGLSAENAGKKAINVSALTDQLITLGKTDKEIYDILTGLQDLDGVVLLDAEGSIDGLTNSLTNLGLAASDGITVNVDAEALAPLLSELNFTKEQAEDLITKLGEADGISLTNSQGEIKDTTDALEYLNGLDFATVTSNVDGVAQAVEDVDDETTDNVVDQFNNIETAASDAETAVKRVQTAVQHLDGQTATVTIDTKRKSGILGSIFGYASGTGAAPAGDALVGEEGAELIQSGDKAYLAGVNGAEVVNLKQGDRVYTADETKRIVHGSGKQLKGVIPAYAKGRVQTGGLHVETGKTGSSGTPITFNATVEATIDDKTLEEQLKDKLDDLEDQLSDIIGNFEHSIFLLEKNDGTPEQIIAIYRKMQETVHAQAEKYRALGLDDTSDYIQDLQKKWWDYQDTIEDMLHDIYQTAVDNHNNMLSLLENQYDMLDNNQTKDAMLDNLYKQLEEQKKIQEEAHKEERRLRDLGLDENDEAIQDCIDAWWGAYNDIQDINSKIADNVLDTFDDFIDYADDFDLWGDFNFTKVDYLKQKLKEINRLFEEGVLTLKEYNSLMRETGVEIYNEQKDALTKIIEMTMELIRQEAEDQVDALEAQIDAYKKIIELKKQSLQASFDEDSYQKEVAERVEKIAEVRAKLAQLERDTSASANAEKQKLAQELTNLQNDLADYQANYSYEAQVDALDKEADTFEDTKNDEISYVKSTVDTEEKVYNAAIARINSNWEQLYADLIEWNKQYGDMIDGEDSITSAWRTAKAAAQEYGDVVSALNGINSEISYAGKNADDKQTQIDRILSKMQTNSKGWHTAKTQEEKNRLVKENEDLAEQLSALLGRKVVKANGVWYLDSANGPRLFHTGLEQGYVGGRSKGSDEVLAVLKAGELVMDQEQYMKVFNSLEYGGGVIDNLVRRLTGTSPAVSEVVKSITNDNSNTDNSSTDDRVTIQNYFQMQNVTEENMKGFAEYYADFTIGKLISANRRKGIRNKVANSMLRG